MNRALLSLILFGASFCALLRNLRNRPPARLALLLLAVPLNLVGTASLRGELIAADNLNPHSFSHSAFGVGTSGLNVPPHNFTNEATAQQFDSLATGRLATVTAAANNYMADGVPLIVSITTAVADRPGNFLGSLKVPASQVNQYEGEDTSYLTTFDFTSQNIHLEAGQSYFVTFTVDTPSFQVSRYLALLLNGSQGQPRLGHAALSSADGLTYFNVPLSGTAEIGLTVRVVPEPTTLALISSALVTAVILIGNQRRVRLRTNAA